ncbi:hypothetical protein V1264_024070 [Littorina saxatilis]|uniref:RNA helicase n=1 Tax=Littorina saxatilis TaxID=31220 RepID=A0AAN9B8I1_9CAEN
MDENWDEGGSSAQPAAVNGSKLRGFGRGKALQQLGTEMNGQTNGFGSSNGTARSGFGGGSSSGGAFGKPSGGGGFGAPKAADEDDGWNEDAPPPSSGGGFGGRGGGFGGGRGGGFGGGRGGGGGGSSGGSGCHKCGEDGHFARECPSGGGGRGGGGGGRGCHKCGEEGHFARECPSGGGGGGGGGRGCHKCGEEGHFARECPSGGGGGGGGGRACHKCGEEGHFARECPSGGGGGGGARSGGGFSRPEGGFGKASDSNGFGAPSGDSGGGSRGGGFGGSSGGGRNDASGGGSGCRRCGEEGHFARECPNKGEGGGQGGACHKCGEEGHFARECPQALADGEKPREIYVPPEADEDDLFKSGIHQGINFDKYDNINIEVTGNDSKFKPISSFEEAGLLPTFLQNVQKACYVKPTPIQKYAIPAILAGRDIMGCAQTGSGKTAAFILPVLTAMYQQGLTTSSFSPVQEPQAIVVAPTRELATQIYTEARKFAARTDIRPVVVYGGTSVGHQMRQVENGANIVVGTPGRLLDFIEKGKISLAKTKFLILDEADRMLDMGFEPCIRKLVDTLGLPPKTQRQTLMFSATFKAEIQRLAADFLNDYLFITVGIVGGACSDVEQTFLEVDRLQKREYLCDILNTAGTQRVLVFVGQKRNADFLASYLSQTGYPTTSIHGDRLQREREEALRDFKSAKTPVMIATNVAARGLDIPDVAYVINYDLPTDIDEYVHRIGRTGRCGNLGKATSFYSQDTDFALASDLVKILSESRQIVPDWLADYASSGGGGDAGRFSGRFASKDIRHKGKFDSGGGDAGGGGGFATTADDESWD